jgi:cell division protein FtsW
MKGRKPFDFWIFLTVMILLSIGIIMVFSASAPYSYNAYHDVYYILKSQLLYAVMGVAAMLFMANFDYRIVLKLAPALLIVSIVFLILVLVPGIGHVENGARRWIYISFIHFQPSEIVKIAVILFFAQSLAKRKDQLKYFFKGLMPYLLLMGLFAVLLILEPHMSCTIIVMSVASLILFSAGARISHFVILFFPAAAAFGGIITFVPYMRDRVLSFLNPWADIKGDGYQIVQSLYAIGSGGLFGRGLGRSMQKFLYLPFPHNDFIFSVLAEELGFVGVVAVLLLFLIFIWRGVKVAMCAPDAAGSLAAIGITSLIAVQTLLNVAVASQTAPPTGVSLPFFSYGGTSLILLMGTVGILLNISRYSNYERI